MVGFQHRDDAERFWADLRERFAQFNLELNDDKTRLIEFGRFAARDREAQGLRKPETFDFLGFTHICAKDRDGRFKLKRVTSKKRMRAKLQRGQDRAAATHASARSPNRANGSAGSCEDTSPTTPCQTTAKRSAPSDDEVTRHWLHTLRRRSQKGRVTWQRMRRLADRWLPQPRILHPWPNVRFNAKTQGRSPVR